MIDSTFSQLAQLAVDRQAQLDEGISAWRNGAGSGVHLWCMPECGNCCTLTVNATLPEALAIAAGLDDLRREQLAATAGRILHHAGKCSEPRSFLTGYRQAVGPCPFLDDAANCSIYPVRPLACRALLSTRPAGWCGINLADLPAVEKDAFVASLDRSVVAWPSHYAAFPQQLAADIERGVIFSMLRFFGFALSGTLPLLVWLASQPGFKEALTGGIETCRDALRKGGCDLPFLVQVIAP